MRRITAIALAAIGTFAGATAPADVLHLKDGSRLQGELREIAEGVARMKTAFADELSVPRDQLEGVATEEKRFITLSSGDRIEGRLAYEDGTQRIVDTAFGAVTVEPGELAAVRPAGAQPPTASADAATAAEAKAARQRAEKAEKRVQAAKKQAEQAQKQLQKYKDPWSGTFEFGFSGESGNTSRQAFRGRASAKRKTPGETLSLFAQGRYATEEGERTTNEIRGGARLDVDVSERWFLFGKGSLEFDEFENLDLRTTLSTGVGYTFIDEADESLTGRVGAGYRHESFTDGTTQDEGIVELGYEYTLDLNEWVGLIHAVTVEPSLTETGEFRLEHETAAEIPLTKEKAWKLKLSVENQYDSNPQPGIEKLDTAYLASLVYDWE